MRTKGKVSICGNEGCPGRKGCRACRRIAARGYRQRDVAAARNAHDMPASDIGSCIRCGGTTSRMGRKAVTLQRVWMCEPCQGTEDGLPAGEVSPQGALQGERENG